MCATDLMVEDELGPQTNNNTVVMPPEIMLAFERHNKSRADYDLPQVTLEDFVITGLTTHLKRIWPGIMKADTAAGGDEELPSSVAARHLLNPELGDTWSRFGHTGKIVVVKIDALDNFVVWSDCVSQRDTGFFRINRSVLCLWVYGDTTVSSSLSGFLPNRWTKGCCPADKESQEYDNIVRSLGYDYKEAVDLR